jgi:bifunctional pyridoxal-dependent enzyme with beta-cystathionase and maltose regulon repressor activities
MKYNFDEIIDRKNSDSIKWDATKIFKIKSHTNVMDVYEAEDNAKACYLLTDDNIDEALDFIENSDATVKCIQQFYDKSLNETWYLYISDIQLMH